MTLATTVNAQIDQQAILRELGLNPQEAASQAVILICDRYGMDVFLKHIVLIGKKPYVTRDGLLHVAHRSGQFDGQETEQLPDDAKYWYARASIFRKDMTHPFTFVGRYPKDGDNKKYGPEMAIKCAEVAALRRAFDVTGIPTLEESWIDAEATEVEPAPEPQLVTDETGETLRTRINSLGQPAKDAWKAARLPALTKLTEEQLDRAEELLARLESEEPF